MHLNRGLFFGLFFSVVFFWGPFITALVLFA